MSSLSEPFKFNFFKILENKLSDDEKLIILSFLDIKTLCSLNCVSKFNFGFSKLSNNDKFWEHYYKKIINDYYNLDFNAAYFNEIDVNKIKTEKEILLNKNENFKENLILFFKNMFKQTKDLQQKRLNKIQYNVNHMLFTKEMFLLKENNKKFNETFLKSVKENYKFVIIGNSLVGKTCMSMVLANGRLNHFNFVPTIYENYIIDYEEEQCNNKTIKLSFWDTGGCSSFDKLRPLHYPKTDLFILCFSIANYNTYFDSFNSITKNWMVELKHYNPETSILLCATKIDLRENKKEIFKLLKLENPIISREEGEAKAKEIGAIGYIETSSFNFIGFDNLNKYLTCLAIVGNKKEKKSNKSCFLQ